MSLYYNLQNRNNPTIYLLLIEVGIVLRIAFITFCLAPSCLSIFYQCDLSLFQCPPPPTPPPHTHNHRQTLLQRDAWNLGIANFVPPTPTQPTPPPQLQHVLAKQNGGCSYIKYIMKHQNEFMNKTVNRAETYSTM